MQWLSSISLEIYHIKEIYDHSIYGSMRIIIMVIGQLVIDILCIICMIIVFVCVDKYRKSPETFKKFIMS